MICDDLEVSRTGTELKVLKNGGTRTKAMFERPLPAARPQVGGKDASLDEAIAAAANLFKDSRLPMLGGLATDVDGIRAALALADRTGGVVDHAFSEAQLRNFRVVQTSGWITSTLTETRNRADLIVMVGTDASKMHDRFFERVVAPAESMFDEAAGKRTVVFIGEGLNISAAKSARVGEVIELPCPTSRLTEVLGVLAARLRGATLHAQPADGTTGSKRGGILSSLLSRGRGPGGDGAEVAGVKLSLIDALAEKCKAAKYGVMVWSAADFNFPHADLTVHLISEIVKELNVRSRFAGLTLGGGEGAASAQSVATWQTGYPARISYASGAPQFDTYRNSIGRMIAENEGDLLLWISSFNPDLGPPATRIPTIVLGTPGLKLSQPPQVYIPVGTPGLDHAGALVRCDGVVSLPLKDLGRSRLPRVADVLAAMEKAL
jgi:formylmethanofuran dehydrogenase subunit B